METREGGEGLQVVCDAGTPSQQGAPGEAVDRKSLVGESAMESREGREFVDGLRCWFPISDKVRLARLWT